MRSITVTVTFAPDDDSFDGLSDAGTVDLIANALLRGFPLLRMSELEVRCGSYVAGGPIAGSANRDDDGDDGESPILARTVGEAIRRSSQ